jgi:hypothetical protein
MRAPRITIAAFMAFVMFLGVSFAALRAPTPLWSSAMFTLAVATSGVALLGLICRRGRARTTWAGYFVFGTGYLTLCAGPWCDDHIMPYLLTTRFSDFRYRYMEHTPTEDGEQVWATYPYGQEFAEGRIFGDLNGSDFHVSLSGRGTSRFVSSQLRAISQDGFRRLCHSIAAVLIGLVGMVLARYFAGEDHDETTGGTAFERA